MSQQNLCPACNNVPCTCGDTEDFFLFEGQQFFSEEEKESVDDFFENKESDDFDLTDLFEIDGDDYDGF